MKALILGSAPCVWDDYREAIKLGGYDLHIAINQTGVSFAPVDIWCTMHPENMYKWQSMRKALRLPMPKVITPNRNTRGHDAVISQTIPCDWKGSSAAYAVYIALQKGAKKVVLCGCPLDDSGNVLQNGGKQGGYDHFIGSWEANKNLGRLTNVRSMSGATRDICGNPSKAWLGR